MSKSAAEMGTADLVVRLGEIRAELGSAWVPGWRGIVDEEAAAIIDALEARRTPAALACLADHGLVEEQG